MLGVPEPPASLENNLGRVRRDRKREDVPRTYYGILQERTGSPYWESNNSVYRLIEYHARLKGFHLVTLRALPVAHARNAYCQQFYYHTKDPDPMDTLVMCDADHTMPKDLVQRLAAHTKGVVGALAVARGEVPFICFFGKNANGNMTNMSEWEDGELAEGLISGSGAIAIKRWVLQALSDRAPSWFRYIYGGYDFEPTDEMDFGYACMRIGIPHFCDTSLWIPHATVEFATPDDWRAYVKAHPEVRDALREGKQVLQVPSAEQEVPAVPAKAGTEKGDDAWTNVKPV